MSQTLAKNRVIKEIDQEAKSQVKEKNFSLVNFNLSNSFLDLCSDPLG